MNYEAFTLKAPILDQHGKGKKNTGILSNCMGRFGIYIKDNTI